MKRPKRSGHQRTELTATPSFLATHRALIVLLVLATLAIYSRTAGFDFVDYDDQDYVTENPYVTGGLTLSGIAWAFTNIDLGNWIPLAWISYMVDVTFFGVSAPAHHLVNAVIHALSSAMLFVFLFAATRRHWRSAFVAAVFAIHPLHVESVAWISERKDVLCAFFMLTTMWLYVRYVSAPSRGRYLAVAAGFVLALLSKPMAVTLPVLLLALDFWPLGRLSTTGDVGKAIRNKLPLVALAAIAAVVTLVAQQGAGAVSGLDGIPLGARLLNSVAAYGAYVAQTVWPTHLAVYYPLPTSQSIALVALSGLGLITGLVVALRSARTRPYLLTGFIWFVVLLLPVIGIIQVGLQAHADRYIYLPQTGLVLALAWYVADLVGDRQQLKTTVAAAATIVLVVLAGLTWRQLGYWRDSESLFGHAAAVTKQNYVAHHGLAVAYRRMDRREESKRHYEEAIRIRPAFGEAHANLAELLIAEGDLTGAIRHLEDAITHTPRMPEARVNLGFALHRLGRFPEAIAQYEEAVRLRPRHGPSRMGLALVLADAGRVDEAIAAARQAVALAPNDARLTAAAAKLFARFGR